MFGDDLIIIAIILIAIGIVIWVLKMRRIVELKSADVVVTKSGSKIYSADISIQGSHGAIYYNVPSWIPVFGCIVKRMPLGIIQLLVENYETFAKANARFVITISVYCRISDVAIAAQRFPGNNIEDFINGMNAIIVSAIRKTTANYPVEDIISKRKEIEDEIRGEILADFERWGVILTNVAVETITDAPGVTVIHDISAKKESEIKSLSRQQIAQQNKSADIVEAENREIAEKRKIEADEKIAVRAQQRDKEVAMQEQEAVIKRLEVERVQKVTSANIEADASIKKAEGVRQSQIITSEGARQAAILEGEGQSAKNKAVGIAEADVIKAKKVAEAEGLSALADAQKKQQDTAKEIRMIEKDQVVGLALAKALETAKIEYIGSGAPKDFMDLFSVGGGMSTGASIGTMLGMIKKTDPDLHNSVIKAIEGISGKERSTNSGFSFDDITGDSITKLLPLLKSVKPEVYEQLVKWCVDNK